MDGIMESCSESENDGGLSPNRHTDRTSEFEANDLEGEGRDCLQYNGKNYEDLQLEDLNGVEFKTVNEVEEFYALYSLAVGFSVRKHKSDKNREETIRRIILVCSRQGMRRSYARKKQKSTTDLNNVSQGATSRCKGKEHGPHARRVTRCNCEARITFLLCKSSGVYYATEFVTEHNHDVVRRDHVRFLRSHRRVMDHDIAKVTSMRKASIRTCQAFELLVDQAGGYDYVGFTLKDLYNHLGSGRREILVDGDAQAAISFMNMKATQDPLFYCYFCVDQQGRLANLFWRDSQSLIDYTTYGDVLIMDTTYKTNTYGKPLAVFVGVNNHRATVLFGCALLVDETEDTYKWVLSTFITAMDGKTPISVITDGDEAMRNALSSLMPNARQRLCSWHISKNVVSNIHDVDVQKDFFHLIYAGLTIEQWEDTWHYMVGMNGLENNKWVMSMYNKRDKWAEAFFREHFFAGVCSTQRCERMHRNLKGGLGRTMRLYDVLPRVDKTIGRMRDRILEDDFRSLNSDPVIGNHLRCMQEQIAKILTYHVFMLVKDQIAFESKFVIYNRDHLTDPNALLIYMSQYNKPDRKWVVSYNNTDCNASFICSCNLFESDGIPCCHIFAAMKSLMITTFPKSLVKRRWTKNAAESTNIYTTGGFPDNVVRVARYGEMMSESAQLCFAASFSDEGYESTIDQLRRLNVRSKRFPLQAEYVNEDITNGLHKNVVKDPVVCRTKGANTKSPMEKEVGRSKVGPLCGFCSKSGHNIRTCELAKGSQNPVGTGPSQETRASFNPNWDPFDPFQANTKSGHVSQDLSDEDSDGMIYHREEAGNFDFYGGYDNQPNMVSGSMQTGSLNRTSWSSLHSRPSSTDNIPSFHSWPFHNTQ